MCDLAANDFYVAQTSAALVEFKNSVKAARDASMLQKAAAVNEVLERLTGLIRDIQDNQVNQLALMKRINARVDYLAVRAGLDLDAVEGL